MEIGKELNQLPQGCQVTQRSPGHGRAVPCSLWAQELRTPAVPQTPGVPSQSKVVVSVLFKSLWRKRGKKRNTSKCEIHSCDDKRLPGRFCLQEFVCSKQSICVYKEAIRAEGLKRSRWDGPSQELIPLSSSSSTLHCHVQQWEGAGGRRKQPRDR